MENQHKHINGYRDLSQNEINMMNKIKSKGQELEILIDELCKTDNIDLRWVNIGKTNLQQGLMALVRSVAKPSTF